MKWLRRFLWKRRQRIDITVESVEDYHHYNNVVVGSSLKLINMGEDEPGVRTGPDYPPIKIELQGKYTITGLKIIINPWKFQRSFKFKD
jgi:hypothetical protein